MDGDAIIGIRELDFPAKDFKVDGIQQILSNYDFKKENIIALGDSPSDKGMFALSGYSIAVNPKGDIADFADVAVEDDLRGVIDKLRLYSQ